MDGQSTTFAEEKVTHVSAAMPAWVLQAHTAHQRKGCPHALQWRCSHCQATNLLVVLQAVFNELVTTTSKLLHAVHPSEMPPAEAVLSVHCVQSLPP